MFCNKLARFQEHVLEAIWSKKCLTTHRSIWLHYWVRQALTFTMLCDSIVNRDVCLCSKLALLLNFNMLHLLKYTSTMSFFFQCHYCKCHMFICHLFLFSYATVQKSILWRLETNRQATTAVKVLTDTSVMAN